MPHRGFEDTPPERSAVMRAIRSKGTKPEIAVRRALHAAGLRYRIHCKDLPGTPDIVFRSRRVAVNVHGCFWHQHGCSISKVPKSRSAYWDVKLGRNQKRDDANRRRLIDMGWVPVIIWECESKNATRIVERVRAALEGQRVSGDSG